jgi:hypothetical protein
MNPDYYAYAIINPNGFLVSDSVRSAKKNCIRQFVGDIEENPTWKDWYRSGWRCKKVTIEIA